MKKHLVALDKHHSILNDIMVKGELHGFDEQSLALHAKEQKPRSGLRKKPRMA